MVESLHFFSIPSKMAIDTLSRVLAMLQNLLSSLSVKQSLLWLDCLESCERNLVFVLNLSMQKA